MGIELRKEYLACIKKRYHNSGKKQKSAILHEFCQNCGYSRKYAIRILNGTVNPLPKRLAGRRPVYGPIEAQYLKEVWIEMSKCCSKILFAALPNWIPHFYSPGFNQHIQSQLLKMSPATIDRLLKPFRSKNRGIGSTCPILKHRISLQLLKGEVKEPGFIEGDTVAHCGNSLVGVFVNSLTATDVATGWTENRATEGKSGTQIKNQIKDIEECLPFPLKGFASDNGTEFLNYTLANYLQKRTDPVEFVRRRPYKKNDNAHVEQKNWTHVRQLFGYQRIDDQDLVPLMNEIYKYYWNPLRNYFHPCSKLKEKVRIGGRIKKIYEPAKTPYHRLLESEYVTDEMKQVLRQTYKQMNPFHLKRTLDRKLNQFWDLHKKLSHPNERLAA